MPYHCQHCGHTTTDKGNFKSHLGSTKLPNHNMGPFVCQRPGCNIRSVRGDSTASHPGHAGLPQWARDPALAAALDAEVAASLRPAPLAAPVAGPGPSVAAGSSTTAGPLITPAAPSSTASSSATTDPLVMGPALLPALHQDQADAPAGPTDDEEANVNDANNSDDEDSHAEEDEDIPRRIPDRIYLGRTGVIDYMMEASKYLTHYQPEKPLKWFGGFMLRRSHEYEGVDEEDANENNNAEDDEDVPRPNQTDPRPNPEQGYHGDDSRKYLEERGVTHYALEAVKRLVSYRPEKPLKWFGEFMLRRSREFGETDEEEVKKDDETEVEKDDENEIEEDDQKDDEKDVEKEDMSQDQKDDQKEDEKDNEEEEEKDIQNK